MADNAMSRSGLSFEVKRYPSLKDRDDGGFLDGCLHLQGAFQVLVDLHPGDEVVVQIGGADGEILTGGVCEVVPVAFKPVFVKDICVGTTRVHKAKLLG